MSRPGKTDAVAVKRSVEVYDANEPKSLRVRPYGLQRVDTDEIEFRDNDNELATLVAKGLKLEELEKNKAVVTDWQGELKTEVYTEWNEPLSIMYRDYGGGTMVNGITMPHATSGLSVFPDDGMGFSRLHIMAGETDADDPVYGTGTKVGIGFMGGMLDNDKTIIVDTATKETTLNGDLTVPNIKFTSPTVGDGQVLVSSIGTKLVNSVPYGTNTDANSIVQRRSNGSIDMSANALTIIGARNSSHSSGPCEPDGWYWIQVNESEYNSDISIISDMVHLPSAGLYTVSFHITLQRGLVSDAQFAAAVARLDVITSEIPIVEKNYLVGIYATHPITGELAPFIHLSGSKIIRVERASFLSVGINVAMTQPSIGDAEYTIVHTFPYQGDNLPGTYIDVVCNRVD